jgi:hypothetical protein
LEEFMDVSLPGRRTLRSWIAAAVVATTCLAAGTTSASAYVYGPITQQTPSTQATLNSASCGTNACYGWGGTLNSGVMQPGEVAANCTVSGGSGCSVFSFTTPYQTLAGAGFNVLAASCPSACIAVGQLGSDAFTGGTGTIKPPGSVTSRLRAVWCDASYTCVAVGDATNASGVTNAYAIRRSSPSTPWTLLPAPLGTTGSTLGGITCLNNLTAGMKCYAAGSYERNPTGVHLPGAAVVTLDWATNTWTSATVGQPLTPNELSGISCYIRCFAVGKSWTYGSPVTTARALAEYGTINATTGAISFVFPSTTPALPAGATASQLSAVYCWAGDKCRMVGGTTVSGQDAPFSANYTNGNLVWSQKEPLASGLVSGTLSGTSCTVAGCIEVGTATDSSGHQVPIGVAVAAHFGSN